MNAKIRKLLTVIVGVLCSLTAMFALAGGNSGRTLIGTINILANQTVFITPESGAWINPDLCDNSKKIVLLPPGAQGATLAYKDMYALLLGAHLTKRDINVFLGGCTLIGNQTFPVVTRVLIY